MPSAAQKQKRSMSYRFQSRQDAALQLRQLVRRYLTENTVVIFSTSSSYSLAEQLVNGTSSSLDIIFSSPLFVKQIPNLQIGAITEYQDVVLDDLAMLLLNIDARKLGELTFDALSSLDSAVNSYQEHYDKLDLSNKTVILVDDGSAGCLQIRALRASIHEVNPKKILFVSPICSPIMYDNLKADFDSLIYLYSPSDAINNEALYQDKRVQSLTEILFDMSRTRKDVGQPRY